MSRAPSCARFRDPPCAQEEFAKRFEWLWEAGEVPQSYQEVKAPDRRSSVPENKRRANLGGKIGFIASTGVGRRARTNQAAQRITHHTGPNVPIRYGDN